MKTAVYILLSLLLPVLACTKKSDETDPALIGTWTDGNVNYHFYDNKTYGIKYLRTGAGADTVLTDSAYGDYGVNTSKKIISFELKAVIDKDNTLRQVALKASTWNYNITGDTLLEYTSATAQGSLIRKQIVD